MGKRSIEVTKEVTELKTEKVDVLICDNCGREVGNAGRRYFGYSVNECTDGEPDETAMMIDSVLICGECDSLVG